MWIERVWCAQWHTHQHQYAPFPYTPQPTHPHLFTALQQRTPHPTTPRLHSHSQVANVCYMLATHKTHSSIRFLSPWWYMLTQAIQHHSAEYVAILTRTFISHLHIGACDLVGCMCVCVCYPNMRGGGCGCIATCIACTSYHVCVPACPCLCPLIQSCTWYHPMCTSCTYTHSVYTCVTYLCFLGQHISQPRIHTWM